MRVARLRQPGDSLGREHGGSHDHPGGHAPRRDLQCLLEPQRQPDLHRLQGQDHPRHRPPQGDHRRRESNLFSPLHHTNQETGYIKTKAATNYYVHYSYLIICSNSLECHK